MRLAVIATRSKRCQRKETSDDSRRLVAASAQEGVRVTPAALRAADDRCRQPRVLRDVPLPVPALLGGVPPHAQGLPGALPVSGPLLSRRQTLHHG